MARSAQQARLRAQAQAQRAAERAQREHERTRAAAERERKRLHAEARSAEVDTMNRQLDAEVVALKSILKVTLAIDDHAVDFNSLKRPVQLPPFEPGALGQPEAIPDLAAFLPRNGLGRLFRWSKYSASVEEAHRRHAEAIAEHAQREKNREQRLAAARAEYDLRVELLLKLEARQHSEVDRLGEEFERADPGAIVSYFTYVLDASVYPDEFPQQFRIAYAPESQQLVVEYQVPSLEVVPDVKAYKYVKSRDEITRTARPATQRRSLYSSLLAQISLRTIHELFEADRTRHVESVVFNGIVDTVDRGTGQRIRPCLVTVRTTRDPFQRLDLAHVEPMACLQHLNASVSRSPGELAPVRPVLELNMVDPRFVDESDVLSELDQRPNLMELSPSEFESLVTNLFTEMGLETRQTQPSRDGGVDCVGFDTRPIFGGKVVIQAKRYKGTVGVSAVRDLFGTMQNEGASKGILVTTSGYGSASFDFAEGKPIELLSGSHLLHLLLEYTGVEAKIEPPSDWEDPVLDEM